MMTAQQHDLWLEVSAFSLDDADSSYKLSHRLASENGWSYEYTLRAIEEYKRFMFLICFATHPLTPSEEVDQVWHMHLLYTESYWDEFCGKILKRKIHHGPTKGGTEEKKKFVSWYEGTISLYRDVFGHLPPADIWNPTKERFTKEKMVRVDMNKNWVIPKPRTKNIASVLPKSKFTRWLLILATLGIVVAIGLWKIKQNNNIGCGG